MLQMRPESCCFVDCMLLLSLSLACQWADKELNDDHSVWRQIYIYYHVLFPVFYFILM